MNPEIQEALTVLEERIGWTLDELRRELGKLRDDYEYDASQLSRKIDDVERDVHALERNA